MRRKSYSNKSAYGYQQGKSKSSYYPENTKSKFSVKWIFIGLLAVCLLGGSTYLLVNHFQASDIQNTNEEIRNMDVSVKGEEKVKSDWQQDIATLSNTDSEMLDKHKQLIEMALAYKVTEREYKQFKEDILASYEEGDYLALDEQASLTNIFKSYVLNEYTNTKTDLQFKLFISNYYQALSYVYREYETVDSEFVQGKENVMNSALEKLKSE